MHLEHNEVEAEPMSTENGDHHTPPCLDFDQLLDHHDEDGGSETGE